MKHLNLPFKTISLICYVFVTFMSFSQTTIPSNINIKTAPKFIFTGNFNGFNDGPFLSGQSMGINAQVSVCSPCGDGAVDDRLYAVEADLEPIHRFPGGTVGNYYHRYYGGFGYDYLSALDPFKKIYNSPYYTVSASNYLNYSNRNIGIQPYQSNNNIIFPFINKVTSNKTTSGQTVFVLNLLDHYRKYIHNGVLYNPRYDVFNNYLVIDQIDNMAELNASSLNSNTKQIVQENLDAMLTLLNNGVSIKYIEFGNEFNQTSYCYPVSTSGNYYTEFLNGDPAPNALDMGQKIWYHINTLTDNMNNYDTRSKFTLDCFASLCAMYRRILNSYFQDQYSFKYSIPFGEAKYNSSWNQWMYRAQNNIWNNYLVIGKKNFIGYDGVSIHLYPSPTESINGQTSNDVFFTNSVSLIDTWLNENIKNQALTKYVSTLDPSVKIWFTEWNWGNVNCFDITSCSSQYALSSKRFNNTMLDLYGKSEFLFAMIDANTFQQTRTNIYELSNHHYLNNYYSTNPENYEGGLFNMYLNNTDQYIKRASYYAFKIMQPITNNVQGYQYITTTNAGFTNVPSGLKFRAFYKPLTNCNNEVAELYLYYSNTSGNQYNINLNSYIKTGNPTYYIPSGGASHLVAWSNKLYASRGASYGTNGSNGQTDNDLITSPNDPNKTIQVLENPVVLNSSEISTYTIKPYAVGYIKMTILKTIFGLPLCIQRIKNPEILTKEKNETIIYPNPASSEIKIQTYSSINDKGSLYVYDINGQLIFNRNVELTEGNNVFAVDISSLSNAIYIVKFVSTETDVTNKVEVIK
jgi:hypothetical protein